MQMQKHLRRFSDTLRSLSPTKKQSHFGGANHHYENENQEDPIHLNIGGVSLLYENRSWRTDSENNNNGEISASLIEKNRVLEGENQLLKYKLNILMEMVRVIHYILIIINIINIF